VYGIGQQELWLDEAASFHKATSASWLGKAAFQENTPPLYYLILRAWLRVAGQSEVAVRFPSALLGTLFVPTAIWAGREMFNRQVALWSGLFAAVNPIHIYYSQEARAYALLVLALALTYVALWRALQVNTWGRWAFVSVCALTALYSHYSALLGLLPTALLLLLWPEQPDRSLKRFRYAAVLLLSVLLFLPWVLESFLWRTHSSTGAFWIPRAWARTPPLLAIPKTLEVFGLGSHAGLLPIPLKQFTELEFPASLRILGLMSLLGLGVWVAGPWAERSLAIPHLGKKKLWLGVLLAFPLLVLWLISFHKPIYVAGRYDMVAFPAVPLLLGLALAKFQKGIRTGRIIAPVLAAALLVPIAVKLWLYYQAPSPRWDQPVAVTIDTLVGEGDVVLFSGTRRLGVIYYLNSRGYRWEDGSCEKESVKRVVSCAMFPRDSVIYTPVFDASRLLQSPGAVRKELQDILTASHRPSGDVWVVHGFFDRADNRITHEWSELLLFQELERAGFRASRFTGVPGILRFRLR
jgi:4-amino-4-deoxy-L-arabinose transferase-like glycosyltransferase